MGIRYDGDWMDAAKGVVIYLDDDFSHFLMKEEIARAQRLQLNFFAYREGGENMILFSSSESLIEGIGEPGFVIAPFNPDEPFLTIPFHNISKRKPDNHSKYDVPSLSTSYEEYQKEFNNITEFCKKHPLGKVVASRVLVRDESMNVGEAFCKLCKKYPDAFVFLFSTRDFGLWLGASPELLLRTNKEKELMTMALAGTRKNGTDTPWDDKNILEQKIVTDYILELLKSEGLDARLYDTHTRSAGAIEHICSEIVSEIPENFTPQSLTNLLKKLSPTPALCGEPKSEALQLIQTSETFDRGFYGGFCGIYRSPSDFCFNVNIRCLCATENRYCLFAGGGITKDSEIASEWKETEIKLKTILNVIDNTR